ncbi:MAG: hypothetical protein U7123_25545 [Potamolinea sp.]
MKSQPVVTNYGGAIDSELAELKSQFLSPPTPKSPNQKPVSPPIPSTAKSQVDLELEELKSQFLGSPNPKNPPSQT